MWINTFDEPIPTHGMNGEKFLLTVVFHDYYGYTVEKHREVVVGIWSSNCECFFEEKTNLEIRSEDIVEWWKK